MILFLQDLLMHCSCKRSDQETILMLTQYLDHLLLSLGIVLALTILPPTFSMMVTSAVSSPCFTVPTEWGLLTILLDLKWWEESISQIYPWYYWRNYYWHYQLLLTRLYSFLWIYGMRVAKFSWQGLTLVNFVTFWCLTTSSLHWDPTGVVVTDQCWQLTRLSFTVPIVQHNTET